MTTPDYQGHIITVVCAEHWDRRTRPPKVRPWTIARFMGQQRPPLPFPLPGWHELPATTAQVQAAVAYREQHGSLPTVSDPAQADAETFLRTAPPNFTGGDKRSTKVRLIDGQPLTPGQSLTGVERIVTRHVLTCDRCLNAGKKAPRLQVAPETLTRLLDAVAGSGDAELTPMRHVVQLKALAALNGRLGQGNPRE